MKKKSTSLSAFFNLRALLGFVLCALGLTVGVFAFIASHKDRVLTASTEKEEHLERDLPTLGEDEREESADLGRLEQYWSDRLTYPTGNFNAAWLRHAAAQDKRLPSALPAGNFAKATATLNGKGNAFRSAKTSGLSTAGFTALGPQPERMTGCSGCYDYGTTEGRINDIVVDPTTTTNGSIVAYAASVGGGVWKTTNCCSASTTWTAMTDDPLISTINVDTLVIDPNNHNTVYAGTGDLNFGSFGMGSQGILKTTDAGATWTVIGADVFGPDYVQPAGQFPQYDAVGKVRVDPNNSSNLVAGTKKGLFFSNDGGGTWTQCATNSFTTQRQDITGLELTNMGGGVTRVLAAIGTRGFATPVQYDLGAQGANGIYMATMPASGCPTFTSIARNDNGFVFGTQVAASPYTTGAPMNAGSGTPWSSSTVGNQLSRVDLAVAPSNPNVIYAQAGSISANTASGCGNTSGCQLGTWASTDGGTTWSFLTGSAGGSLANCTGAAGSGDYPQNWYDQGLTVDPNNADRVFANTFETWLVSRTGTSWYDTTCGYNGNSVANHVVHVDHHAQTFVPGNSDILLIGDDGGIHGTTNASAAVSGSTRPTWFNMDTGLNTIEFYSGDISGNFANDSAPSAVAGAQDNGPSSVSFAGSPVGPVQWQMGLGGDGFSGQISPTGQTASQAQGTITVSSTVPTAGQMFVVGPQTFTWVASGTATGQVVIGTTSTTNATNIVTSINRDIPTTATAARSGSTVVVTATAPGSAGNSIPFYNSTTAPSANLTFNGSGTLGGTTQGGIAGNPSPVFFEGNNSGGFSRCLTGCTSPNAVWTSIRPAWTADTQSFILPVNLFRGGIPGGDDCPNGCGHIIAGTTRVWETTTAVSTTVSWYVTNNPTTQNLTKQALGNRSYINQVKYSPKFQSVAIAGTNDGNVQIGFNLGTGAQGQANWVDVTGGNTTLPNRPILGIALDPSVATADVPVGYASIGGFNANSPTTPGHLFQVTCASNCSSSTWADKTGNLPDIPADSVIVNPNYPQQVFVGTDWGLYFTNDITQVSPSWSRFDSGLPHAMVWDMSVDRGSTTLALWTRSRGAYVYPLPSSPILTAAPTLASAVSRMTHGSKGTFDLPLPITGPAAIEPRTDGAGHYTIVFNFNQPVNNGSASTSAGTVSNVSYSGNAMIVALSGVADQQTVTVTANNVSGPNTQALPSTSVNVSFLIGDVSGNGAVDAGDVAQSRAASGSSVDSTTFRYDVNIDGVLDANDTTLVRSKSKHFLP